MWSQGGLTLQPSFLYLPGIAHLIAWALTAMSSETFTFVTLHHPERTWERHRDGEKTQGCGEGRHRDVSFCVFTLTHSQGLPQALDITQMATKPILECYRGSSLGAVWKPLFFHHTEKKKKKISWYFREVLVCKRKLSMWGVHFYALKALKLMGAVIYLFIQQQCAVLCRAWQSFGDHPTELVQPS